MRFYIGITDTDWFKQLSSDDAIEEVNFWQPGGNRQFRVLQVGEPFLFKLHSPQNYIVGGGFFSHSTILPVSFAWTAFESRNGCRSETEMRQRITHYRSKSADPFEDYKIGCILLESPFFFGDGDWIPVSDWPRSIVQGKSYDTSDAHALWIWQQVEDRLKGQALNELRKTHDKYERFGKPQFVLPRLGQGSFRVIVTDAYDRKCAFTESPVLHVLDAAHIKPYKQDGEHEIQNGILLRQDVHTLFDRGYITVTPDYHAEVSSRIKSEFHNGHEYYRAHGKPIALPGQHEFRPSKELLHWHNENVFVG
jgi:putative restriction endonuclease